MMNLPPKYSDIELQSILNSDPTLPENMNEENFINDIKKNSKIRWEVNNFLFKKQLLPVVLDHLTFKKWKIFKSLNWLIALSIIGFAIWNRDYRILGFLIIYPLIIIPVYHWIFIFNMTAVIAITLLFKINIPYFWPFVIFTLIGYLLNKAINEMIENKILNQALTDRVTFWKYYSAKIISIDKTALNKEYDILIKKYPELLLNPNN